MDFEKFKGTVIDVLDITTEAGVDVVSSMVFEGLVGSVLPGVTSVMFAYKQKRLERMIIKFMEELKNNQCELEEKINQMSKEKAREYTEKYFGIVTDFVIDEAQENKIKYIVNGFVNLGSIEEISEDFVLSYYDLLNSLRVVDIGILNKHYNDSVGNYEKDIFMVLEEFGINYDQYYEIQNKLTRMGLLISENEEKERSNQKLIKKYLEQSGNPKDGRFDILWKDVSMRDSFTISQYGRQFRKFFVEKY